jgi:hypothetical protein
MRQVWGVWLSPSGDHVAFADESTRPAPPQVVWSRNGATTQFKAGYVMRGFLDDTTVVLGIPHDSTAEQLFVASLDSPSNPRALGIAGLPAGHILPR